MREERSLDRLEATRRSVLAVAQVVRALESLSRAQRASVEEAAGDASRYLDWIDELVGQLAGPPESAAGADPLSIVMGPERGFCGPLAHRIAEQIPSQGALGIVGTRLAEVLDETPAVSARTRFRLPGAAAVEELPRGARELAARILEEHPIGSVWLFHPRDSGSELHAVELLSGPRRLAPRLAFETWSPPERVLELAVSTSVAGRLAVGLAEVLRSEVLARLLATGAARQACEQQLEDLRRSILNVSQEQTTRELLEVVTSHLTGVAST